VFRGDFDLEATEVVCAGASISPADALNLVTGLLEKSIITRSDHDGAARYRMLEPIRQYGLTKLQRAGGGTAVRRRHRDHYLNLAEQGDASWFGPHQSSWFARMRCEHANLRTALNFCLTEPGEEFVGLRMASALWFYWTACGFLKEGRNWLDRALSVNPQPTRLRAKALWLDGRITLMQGDVTEAVSKLEECRALARQLGDEHALAYGTQILGVAHLLSGDLPSAAMLLEEAVARHQANGELNSTALLASLQLALVCVFQDDLYRTVTLCERCHAISDAHEETWARSFALHVLALVAWRRGEWTVAAVHTRECLRLKRTFHDILGLAQSLELLAWIDASAGEYEQAALMLGVAERHWRTFGLPLFGSEYFLAHHETCEKRARLVLGDEGFTGTFRQGNRLTLEQGVTVALAKETDSTQPA
jgi:tetratricopeptide (TPR) repeat protein